MLTFKEAVIQFRQEKKMIANEMVRSVSFFNFDKKVLLEYVDDGDRHLPKIGETIVVCVSEPGIPYLVKDISSLYDVRFGGKLVVQVTVLCDVHPSFKQEGK
jgi:hypothetical protein